MLYFIALLFVFLLSATNGFAQSEKQTSLRDSLMAVWNERDNPDSVRLKAMDDLIWEIYLYKKPDSAVFFASIQYDFAKKCNHRKYMAMALNNQGIALDLMAEYDDALQKYEASLKIRSEIADKQGMASTYNNIGSLHRTRGNYVLAIENFQKSLKLKEEIGDMKGVANSYIGIGNILREQNEYAQAMEYYQKSLEIREGLGDKKQIANSLMAIGNIYSLTKEYNSAIDVYNKCLTMMEALGDNSGKASIWNNLGVIYQEQLDYEKALDFYLKSLQVREDLRDWMGVSTNLINLSVIYEKKRDAPMALNYAKRALSLALEIDADRQKRDAYGTMYAAYKLAKDYKNALEMHESFVAFRDKLANEDNQKSIIRLQYQYEMDKQAAEDSVARAELIKLIDAQEQARKAEELKRDAEADARRKEKYMLYGGISLLFVLALLIFNRFRLAKRKNRIIQDQQWITEIQKEQIETKHKEITDSIRYAKRIQDAILPSMAEMNVALRDGFVLFLPKDVVAGDFYWMEMVDVDTAQPTVFVAAADCTGHGVPGALVSVVCSNALSKALLEENIRDPGKLLDRTRELIIQRFARSGEDVVDGMDISLVALASRPVEPDNYLALQWAGANNPLWIIRNGHGGVTELVEVRPDKQPIGKYSNAKPFAAHHIDLQPGDTFYLFTDGFQDQFGGVNPQSDRPAGKKFKAANLKALLLSIQHESMDKQKELLVQAFNDWRGDMEQVDDVCIIGVRV